MSGFGSGSEEYDLVDDEVDLPWADPQIQADYEAALGNFLVRFNRIENRLTRLIELALQTKGRSDLAASAINVPFRQRLKNLELILLADHPLDPADISALAGLAAQRNELAHGHFDQNPFSGAYEIVGTKNSRTWTPADVSGLAAEADRLWNRMGFFEATLQFSPFIEKAGQ